MAAGLISPDSRLRRSVGKEWSHHRLSGLTLASDASLKFIPTVAEGYAYNALTGPLRSAVKTRGVVRV